MTIVAEQFAYVIGIDTHAQTHTYAVIETSTGARIACEAFPVNKSGINRAIAWIQRNCSGNVLAAIEGTNSYGSSIRRALNEQSILVTEVKPPRRKARNGVGKSDQIDAISAAMSVLGHEIDTLVSPRQDGTRAAISVLLTARRRVILQRTSNRNALNALLRQIDLGIDARKALSDRVIGEISAWRIRDLDTIDQRAARAGAVELAQAILKAKRRTQGIDLELAVLDEQLAPGMQAQPGMGPVTLAIILASYSHAGRFRSEASFAALAGVSPLQASSGNTVRHRLNRGGDRQLNMALDVIAKSRMRFDERTQKYVERRTAEGRTYREIKRCVKRFLARSIFRQLEQIMC